MLRRIRLRLRPPPFHHARPTSVRPQSAVAYKVPEEVHERERHAAEEPYGMQYGAGPSRIPYQPLAFSSRSTCHPFDQLDSSSPSGARSLRQRLHEIPHGSYADLARFAKSLLPSHDMHDALRSFSRSEVHTIVHHLIRLRKGNLAAAFVWQLINITPRMKRQRLFSTRTIATLFHSRKLFSLPSARSIAPRQPPPNLEPTLAEQISPSPSPTLATLIAILEALQDVRVHRTSQMYQLVVRQCLEELLPELAAKVYVGLVEEWVTEGRVAEGADPEDFHPGGGPPREQVLQRKQISDMVRRWWTGVRTWRLPGEVLSPHDRLDLWHPRHLSLGEKMRNFPFPLATSPPSTVPQPDSNMLVMILASLKLDPQHISPAQFASSMRALAILANTVLSRTLPIPALGRLLQVFKNVPYKPDVFPDNVSIRPEDNAWAYTAFTQIHVTLMSLLFSPPISADSIRMIEAHQLASRATSGCAHEVDAIKSPHSTPQSVSPYMLPPLSWASCRVILYYALSSLRKPDLLKTLLQYMRETFALGGKNPTVYNTLLQCASNLRDNALARRVETVLFGPVEPLTARRRIDNTVSHGESVRTAETCLHEELEPTEEGDGPIPDEQSLVHLLTHLTVTSDFDRLVEYVYRLIPFLEYSEQALPEEVAWRIREDGLIVGQRGRPVSEPLSPDIYAVILMGLEKAGRTGLAQRVFSVALRSEAQTIDKYIEATRRSENVTRSRSRGGGEVPAGLKLPIGVFTTMLKVWENEYQSFRRAGSTNKPRTARGWKMPAGHDHVLVEHQPAKMALLTHDLVKERYIRGAGRGRLDKSYYEALIRACAGRWGLDTYDQTHRNASGGGTESAMIRTAKKEMSDLAYDLKRSGTPVPEIVTRRLTGDGSGRLHLRFGYGLWDEEDKGGQHREHEEAREAPAVLLRRIMGSAGDSITEARVEVAGAGAGVEVGGASDEPGAIDERHR